MNKRQLKKFKKKLGYKKYNNALATMHKLLIEHMNLNGGKIYLQELFYLFEKKLENQRYYCQPIILPEYQEEYNANI